MLLTRSEFEEIKHEFNFSTNKIERESTVTISETTINQHNKNQKRFFSIFRILTFHFWILTFHFHPFLEIDYYLQCLRIKYGDEFSNWKSQDLKEKT